MATPRPSSAGLYLDLDASSGAAERLSAALGVAAIEAVLIRPIPASPGRPPDPAALRPLVSLAQSRGAAAIIAGDIRLAATVNADGVHLPWSADIEDVYKEARRVLGPGMIVGAEGGSTRHDPMVLAEAGADYIAFTATSAIALDTAAAHAEQLAAIAWWAELFEVPSVALGIDTIEAAGVLAGAGADFIGWRLAAGDAPADTAASLTSLLSSLGITRRNAPQAEQKQQR